MIAIGEIGDKSGLGDLSDSWCMLPMHLTTREGFMAAHKFLVSIILFFGSVNLVAADITIRRAEITNGSLNIEGRVRPRQPNVTIEIDGARTSVDTKLDGRFSFKGKDFPVTCKVELSGGSEKSPRSFDTVRFAAPLVPPVLLAPRARQASP